MPKINFDIIAIIGDLKKTLTPDIQNQTMTEDVAIYLARDILLTEKARQYMQQRDCNDTPFTGFYSLIPLSENDRTLYFSTIDDDDDLTIEWIENLEPFKIYGLKEYVDKDHCDYHILIDRITKSDTTNKGAHS